MASFQYIVLLTKLISNQHNNVAFSRGSHALLPWQGVHVFTGDGLQAKITLGLATLALSAMGHDSLDFQLFHFSGYFRAAQTLAFDSIRLHIQ